MNYSPPDSSVRGGFPGKNTRGTCVYEEKKVSSEEGGKGRRRYLRQRVMESVVIPSHTNEKTIESGIARDYDRHC